MKKYLFVILTLFLVGCNSKKASPTVSSSEKTSQSTTEVSTEMTDSSTENISSTEPAPLISSSVEVVIEQPIVENNNNNNEISYQAQLEQAAQDRFWEAKSWGYTDEQAGAYADGREIPIEPVVDEDAAAAEAIEFRQAFFAEHGREPTSGEMQAHWFENQGH